MDSATVAVIGAGKMGVPIASLIASRGFRVVACDADGERVAAINAGRCPIDEPGVPELLAAAVAADTLRATTATADAVAASEIVIVLVPVALTETDTADLSAMEAAIKNIGEGLGPGAMVIIETTLPVGTTRRLGDLLAAVSGLMPGQDFDLAFSGERVKSRYVLRNLTQIPKVVGGLTPAATKRAAAFYAACFGCPIIEADSLEASEMVKLAGMIYRDVNIALANELARYAENKGLDVRPIIAAANTDNEGHILTPGIGVGGHCTPVYPYFLIRDAEHIGQPVELTETARRLNREQPAHVAARIHQAMGPLDGRSILILGLAFRPQVKEATYSPAFALRDELERLGGRVAMHDPLFAPAEIESQGFSPLDIEGTHPLPETVVLVTAHHAYADIDFAQWAARGVRLVVDGRQLWSRPAIESHGLTYLGVGSGIAVSVPAT